MPVARLRVACFLFKGTMVPGRYGMRQIFLSGLFVSACLPMTHALGQSATTSSASTGTELLASSSLTDGSGLRTSYDASAAAAVAATSSNAVDSLPGSRENMAVGTSSIGPSEAQERVQQGGDATAEAIGPYDPLGMRLGQFLFYPSLTLWGEATDNVDATASGEDGVGVSPEIAAKLQSDWSRHSLTLNGSAAIKGYQTPNRKPEDDEHLSGELRLDMADDTQLTISGSFDRSQEDKGSVELNATGQSATYETGMTGGLTLDHQAGLVDLQLRGSVGAMRYEDEDSRDYDTYRVGARVGVALTDQIMPFVDAELTRRQYKDDNHRQNGDSLRGAIGIEVSNREKLSGELSAGVISWDPDLAGQSGDTAFFVDASLAWSPNALWTIRGGLETDLTSTSTVARSVATHRVSLEADYAILRNLELTASGAIAQETYNGIGRHDWVFDATLNATYSFNRNVQLIASVGRSQRDSNLAGEDTTTHTVRLGLRLQR
ncbi:outer membrane beta-barrel protein [uncultured Cohaesibacter sp.]|uniref:outer membrane beta-barrel protein n=1 Tax=uncultured Cohaesibacter sp. TaxID=1002546 RepID=UPI00374795C1